LTNKDGRILYFGEQKRKEMVPLTHEDIFKVVFSYVTTHIWKRDEWFHLHSLRDHLFDQSRKREAANKLQKEEEKQKKLLKLEKKGGVMRDFEQPFAEGVFGYFPEPQQKAAKVETPPVQLKGASQLLLGPNSSQLLLENGNRDLEIVKCLYKKATASGDVPKVIGASKAEELMLYEFLAHLDFPYPLTYNLKQPFGSMPQFQDWLLQKIDKSSKDGILLPSLLKKACEFAEYNNSIKLQDII
jgi:hypothetical protein